jgi:hypothetical protein
MRFKLKIKGGLVGVIGFLLSPLSWWNDMVVNVPLAVGFGWVISLFYRPAFGASVVVGYWLTNIIGLLMLHLGARQMVTEQPVPFSRRELVKAVIVSLLYTLVVVELANLKFIGPLAFP